VLLGAGGVALGFPLADPIVGLIITIAILAVLRTAVRDIFRRLMDAVDPELVDAAEAALAAQPGVTSVRSVKMRWIGHRIHADAELDIDPATSLSDAHQLAHDAEHALPTPCPNCPPHSSTPTPPATPDPPFNKPAQPNSGACAGARTC
jgi:divalent metal cation (Fe/Co/Zn/Cd) transporter